MPFLIAYLPQDTPMDVLLRLRVDLVREIHDQMECPKSWVRPLLRLDVLPDPVMEDEGCSTVLAIAETGLFDGGKKKYSDEEIRAILRNIGDVIWNALDRKYEVEATVSSWNLERKILIEAE